jgi:formylglycine-generating enzyme required for sulfatase activity
MNKKPFLTLSAAFIIFAAMPLAAQVPQLLEYNGLLSGNITGNRTMGVRLYNASTNGTLLYSETIGTVAVTQGEFYFTYGGAGAGIAAALSGNQHWLAITVNGTEQTPRERLLPVPFALRSADAQVADADLRKVVDAVGKLVVAFGGNSSSLLTNPTATIATMQKQATNLQEMSKRFRVISLDGSLVFGNASTVRPMTIANTGMDRLVVSGITYPAGFSGNWSGGTILPGQSRTVGVKFTPTNVQQYGGYITVNSDATAGTNLISCSGSGVRSIAVNGGQLKLWLGNTLVNSTKQATLGIRNTGTMNLTVSNISYPAGFSGNWAGGTIPAGITQNVTVTFAPGAVQTYGGNITIASNAGVGIYANLLNKGVEGTGTEIAMVNVPGPTTPPPGSNLGSFQIGKYEVTWEEWKAVRDWAAANGYDIGTKGNGSVANQPARQLDWHTAVKWCNALSEMSGLDPVYITATGAVYKNEAQNESFSAASTNGYRLPTNHEWIWAAKGGLSSNDYLYSGSNDLGAVAWWGGNSGSQVKAVGTKAANELGIHDMSGNVWEWCYDDPPNYELSILENVIRGGASNVGLDGIGYFSPYEFGWNYFNTVSPWIGLRVVRNWNP